MFAEKALNLVKELSRTVDTLPPYNSEAVRDVAREILQLTQSNQELVQQNDEDGEGTRSFLSTVKIQHEAIQRNVRCLTAYHYNRLRKVRDMRWEFGSILPPDIKSSLSSEEFQWFKDYNRILANYMRNIGNAGGMNLCADTKPPKSLYVEVKCVSNYGKFELSDGTVVNLKENTRYFLPRRDCEDFIRQGIFEHIVS